MLSRRRHNNILIVVSWRRKYASTAQKDEVRPTPTCIICACQMATGPYGFTCARSWLHVWVAVVARGGWGGTWIRYDALRRMGGKQNVNFRPWTVLGYNKHGGSVMGKRGAPNNVDQGPNPTTPPFRHQRASRDGAINFLNASGNSR